MYQHTLLATPLNDKFLEVDTKMIKRFTLLRAKLSSVLVMTDTLCFRAVCKTLVLMIEHMDKVDLADIIIVIAHGGYQICDIKTLMQS